MKLSLGFPLTVAACNAKPSRQFYNFTLLFMFYVAKTGGFDALLGDAPLKTRNNLRTALANTGCRQALAAVAQEYLDATAAGLLHAELALEQAAHAAIRLWSLTEANDSPLVCSGRNKVG